MPNSAKPQKNAGKPQKIAILGDGITANSVKKTLARLSGFTLVPVENADLIVASPGIPPQHYPETTVEIISEIEFAWRLFHRPEATYCPTLIGITGTNGKSTVTSLIGHILDVPATGNIGMPLIEYVDHPDQPTYLAVELSSYQLETCFEFQPRVAVLLNLTPDHLERHKTMDSYAEAKARIFQAQQAADTLVYNQDDTWMTALAELAPSQKIPFYAAHPEMARLTNLKIPGPHNQMNALAAFLAVRALGMSDIQIIDRIRTYGGLEHRLETVLTVNDRTFINDSKATNPDSTTIAVNAFQGNVQLIVCGNDKQLALAHFVTSIRPRIKNAIAYGGIADRFIENCLACDPAYPVIKTASLEEALATAWSYSEPGDVILFSPSQSSFDLYNNFEHRGQVFKEMVHALYGTKSPAALSH